jgi:MFS family permease
MKPDGLLPKDIKIRSSKYLNNLIGQDHRNIKSRTNVMLGFKRLAHRSDKMVKRQLRRWWSAIGGTLSASTSSGVITIYAFGVFAKAMGAEYGWSRASISLGLMVWAVANGLGAACLGWALDRWGVKRATISMTLLFGVSLASVAFLPPYLWLYLAVFGVVGFFSAAATPIPYSLVVSAWFDRSRGLALGVVNSGNGLGGTLMPFFASFLLLHYGWRGGYLGVALVATLVPLFALTVLVRLPAGFDENRRRARMISGDNAVPLSRIMRTSRHFWLLALAIFSISIATFGTLSQLTPMITDRGVSIVLAASIMSAASISSTCSRLGVGLLLDRFFAPYVTAAIFALLALGIWLVSSSHSAATLVCGAALLGIGIGAEGDVLTYLISRYFSLHSFGKVTGTIWLSFCLGGATGVYLLNLSFARTMSYETATYAFIAVVLVGLIAVLNLGPYVFAPKHADTLGESGRVQESLNGVSIGGENGTAVGSPDF